VRTTCAKLASGVLALAAGRAAAAAKATGRLLGRIGAPNAVFAASLFALCLAACAWPWLVLKIVASAVGILVAGLLLMS
jgi:hypothetical protein